MDMQGHLLEYDLNPVFHGRTSGRAFPQQYCGEDDPRVCYSIEHFLESFFLRSDTNVVVLSALPIYPEGTPLSPEIMDRDPSHRGGPVPGRTDPPPRPGAARTWARSAGARGWRTPRAATRSARGRHSRTSPTSSSRAAARGGSTTTSLGCPQVGEPFIRTSLELGIPTICVHKGLSGGSRYSSPMDIGPAAAHAPRRRTSSCTTRDSRPARRGPVHGGDGRSRA